MKMGYDSRPDGLAKYNSRTNYLGKQLVYLNYPLPEYQNKTILSRLAVPERLPCILQLQLTEYLLEGWILNPCGG